MWRLAVSSLLVVGTQAFAPAPIRWGGADPSRTFVLTPQQSANQDVILTLADRSGTTSPNQIPKFVPRPDKTIALDATGLCIEAIGHKNGDAIRAHQCTGEPTQQWNVLPWGSGHKNRIQLHGSTKCIDVDDREGDLNGAPVQLEECDGKVTESWNVDSFPLPTAIPSQQSLFSKTHAMMSMAALAALASLSLGAWVLRATEKSNASQSTSLNFDEGGISLSEPLATSLVPGCDMNVQKLVPAVMAVSPEDDAKENKGIFGLLRKGIQKLRRGRNQAPDGGFQCTVLGAAGGIGQSLALLLKLNPRVGKLHCYDIAPFTPGLGVDLNHISSNSECVGFTGDENLKAALTGSDVVVIPAGMPRKPGMTRDDLFNINAGIVKTLVKGCAEACPDACIIIITNPVNSLVPAAMEVLKAEGCYNPKKLMGVTALDVCRARTFVADLKGLDVDEVSVPVVGGHAGTTIVPLLSQTEPSVSFTDEERDTLSNRIAFGGDEVVQAKAGAGSATLSMAYTGAAFADRVMAGLAGEPDVVECAFVESSVTDAKFFSSPCKFGKDGIEEVKDYGTVNDYEKKLIADMLPDLVKQNEKGIAWAKDSMVPAAMMVSPTPAEAPGRTFKCTVLGAGGGIGQPLSLLLKLNPRVAKLNCFDLLPATPGIGVDLNHISSNSDCVGFAGNENLSAALDGAEVVVIPAGVPRKPGMTRDDLFNVNAGVVKSLVTACAEVCPNACIIIITNPVNSLVPVAREVLKAKGVYDPKKLMGVTALDVCRARTFVAEAKGLDVNTVSVPVVGGHAGTTIVPLLSQTKPKVTFTDEERDAMSNRISFGGDEVVQAKDGAGSATLSMAYTGAEFADRVMAGLAGEPGVRECAFVESSITEAEFFSSPCTFGKNGVEEVHAYGNVSDFEKKLIADMMPDLLKQAEKGIAWAKENI